MNDDYWSIELKHEKYSEKEFPKKCNMMNSIDDFYSKDFIIFSPLILKKSSRTSAVIF
jgi:hypothetical protein